MIRISVIIPVYNAEAYLRECLDSVLGQSLREIEVVCVDDGSTDGSAAILSEYAARDPRLRVIRGEHAGAYKARERAFAVIGGEYVHFMDADDVLAEGAYEACFALCERERLDHLVFTAENFITADNPDRFRDLKEVYDRYYRLDDAVCGQVFTGRELFGRLVNAGCFFEGPPLRLIRVAPFRENDFPIPDALFHGDSYYSPISLYLSTRAMAVNRRYYRRRLRPDSITTSTGRERVHLASSLGVLSCLCRFPPFATDAAVPDSAASRYLKRIAEAMVGKSRGLDEPTVTAEVARTFENSSSELRALVLGVLAPSICRLCAEVETGPSFVPTIRSCSKYVVKRLVRRLFDLEVRG